MNLLDAVKLVINCKIKTQKFFLIELIISLKVINLHDCGLIRQSGKHGRSGKSLPCEDPIKVGCNTCSQQHCQILCVLF